jgi:hypothetical protein
MAVLKGGDTSNPNAYTIAKMMQTEVRPIPDAIYRGISVRSDNPYGKSFFDAVDKGKLHLYPQSFSTDSSVAQGFSGGKVVLKVDPGATGLDVDSMLGHAYGEFEKISGGDFQVLGVDKSGPTTIIHLRQITDFTGKPLKAAPKVSEGTFTIKPGEDIMDKKGFATGGTESPVPKPGGLHGALSDEVHAMEAESKNPEILTSGKTTSKKIAAAEKAAKDQITSLGDTQKALLKEHGVKINLMSTSQMKGMLTDNGLFNPGDPKILGLYKADTKVVHVVMDQSPAQAKLTTMHELTHALDEAMGNKSGAPLFHGIAVGIRASDPALAGISDSELFAELGAESQMGLPFTYLGKPLNPLVETGLKGYFEDIGLVS